MAAASGTISFTDAKRNVARMRFYVGAGSTFSTLVGDIVNAVTPLTNASVNRYTGAPAAPLVGGGAGIFQNVEDKAVAVFVTATGAMHRYQIPAPKEALFFADTETLLPTGDDIEAFIAAMIAHTTSRDGTALSAFVGGYRRRVAMIRKINIWTLGPDDVTPEE